MSSSPQLSLNINPTRRIKLSWTHHANQRTVYHIERSENNEDFQKIGVLNTEYSENYEFLDLFPPTGKKYYRLVTFDETGNKIISNSCPTNTLQIVRQ
ncbi:MAG: hypothetical protein GY827_05350 [Cytophagales bacterium]|nr:hypothetical protein [Cytophagales bacterium]